MPRAHIGAPCPCHACRSVGQPLLMFCVPLSLLSSFLVLASCLLVLTILLRLVAQSMPRAHIDGSCTCWSLMPFGASASIDVPSVLSGTSQLFGGHRPHVTNSQLRQSTPLRTSSTQTIGHYRTSLYHMASGGRYFQLNKHHCRSDACIAYHYLRPSISKIQR